MTGSATHIASGEFVSELKTNKILRGFDMEKKKSNIWKNYKFPLILLSSIILGSIIGLVLGEKATVLKPLGDIFLNLMFTIVVPLVFLNYFICCIQYGGYEKTWKNYWKYAFSFL